MSVQNEESGSSDAARRNQMFAPRDHDRCDNKRLAAPSKRCRLKMARRFPTKEDIQTDLSGDPHLLNTSVQEHDEKTAEAIAKNWKDDTILSQPYEKTDSFYAMYIDGDVPSNESNLPNALGEPPNELIGLESHQSAKRAPPSNRRAPSRGRRAPLRGRRAPSRGRRAPLRGRRAPSSGKRAQPTANDADATQNLRLDEGTIRNIHAAWTLRVCFLIYFKSNQRQLDEKDLDHIISEETRARFKGRDQSLELPTEISNDEAFIAHGKIFILCRNQETANWFMSIVPKIAGLTEGVQYAAHEMGTTFYARLPARDDAYNAEEVIHTIRSANHGFPEEEMNLTLDKYEDKNLAEIQFHPKHLPFVVKSNFKLGYSLKHLELTGPEVELLRKQTEDW